MPDVKEIIEGLAGVKNAVLTEFVSEEDRPVIIEQCVKYINGAMSMLKEQQKTINSIVMMDRPIVYKDFDCPNCGYRFNLRFTITNEGKPIMCKDCEYYQRDPYCDGSGDCTGACDNLVKVHDNWYCPGGTYKQN